MVDPTPQDAPPARIGTGDGGGVSKTAFYTTIIPVLASALIMPMWMEYLKYKRDIRSEQVQLKILEAQTESAKSVDKLRDGQIETHEVLQTAVGAQQDTHEKLTKIEESLSKPVPVGLASPNVSITVLPGPKEVQKQDAPDEK